MAEGAVVRYETDKGEIELSPSIVRQYLVNGNGNVTDQEVKMFVELCRYQKLNPFIKEAYLIKFGSKPATLVVGKDVMTKRAAHNEQCAGFEAGVMVLSGADLIKRGGTLVLPGEKLVGGWADVYRHDWTQPLTHTVALGEFERHTFKDGKQVLMANWAKMPGTMIRKVALVQALREAFPDDLQGLYDADEMPVEALPPTNSAPIAPTTQPAASPKPKAQPKQTVAGDKIAGRMVEDAGDAANAEFKDLTPPQQTTDVVDAEIVDEDYQPPAEDGNGDTPGTDPDGDQDDAGEETPPAFNSLQGDISPKQRGMIKGLTQDSAAHAERLITLMADCGVKEIDQLSKQDASDIIGILLKVKGSDEGKKPAAKKKAASVPDADDPNVPF